MNEMDEFQSWVDLWAKAEEKFRKETPEKPVMSGNFFGLQTQEVPEDEMTNDPSWQEIYSRSQDLSNLPGEELLNEIDVDKTSGLDTDQVYHNNPIQNQTVGSDASKNPYQPARVTQNWTHGKELDQLNDYKIALEKLESKLQAASVRGELKGDYMSQLNDLRKKIDQLSNQIHPGRDDVT